MVKVDRGQLRSRKDCQCGITIKKVVSNGPVVICQLCLGGYQTFEQKIYYDYDLELGGEYSNVSN